MATPQNPFQPDNQNTDPFANLQPKPQGFDPNANPVQDFTQPQEVPGEFEQPQPFDTFDGTQTPNTTVDFNQEFSVDPNPVANQDYTAQDYTQDYTQDYVQDPNAVEQQDFAQTTADYPTQETPGAYDEFAQPLDNPADAPQSIAANTTFEENKGGNKVFYFIIGGIIIIIAIIAATLFALNFANRDDDTNNDNPTTDTSQQSDNTNNQTPVVNTPEQEPVSDVISGGADTPATLSRRNSETSAPVTWFQQYFTAPYIDSQGACLTVSFCDIQADPDNDGLSNLQEYNFGTDPQRNDTDQDGIADGDEILRYFTSARSKDSDNDGFEDIDELSNCFDPILNNETKMVESRLSQLSSNISISPLREPTRTELIKAGASNTDVQLRGYNSSTCPSGDETPSTESTETTEQPS